MGTVSIDNTSVEERLRSVETKVETNTSTVATLLRDTVGALGSVLKQLNILRVHQEITTNNVVTKDDVKDVS